MIGTAQTGISVVHAAQYSVSVVDDQKEVHISSILPCTNGLSASGEPTPAVGAEIGLTLTAPDIDALLAKAETVTGLAVKLRDATRFDNVYALGEVSLLFTGHFRDHHGHPLARAVALSLWSSENRGGREHLVPPPAFYHDHSDLLYHCALAYLGNLPLALHGHTGVGKTELVKYFATLLGAPLYRMNLHGLSTTDDIIGKLIPVGSGRVGFQEGLVTTAVRNGGILLLEEMNATGQEVWFALHGLLDGSRALVLVEKDNEVVPQHALCRLYSTFNPAEYPNLYPGTKELSAAYLRRWSSVRVAFAELEVERAILLARFPELEHEEDGEVLNTMLKVAQVARKLLDDRARSFDFVMSTGVLVAWAELTRFLGPLMGARVAFYDILNEKVKAVFRDQIFSYITDWEVEQLETIPYL